MEEPIRALGKRYVIVAGSFAPNGSSAISAASNKGKGFTVAWTSTGLYTITFTDKWTDLVSFTASLQLTTAADDFIQVGVYNATNRTITVRTWDVSDNALANIAADAGNRINFCAIFRNTSITGGTSA
jgi:hypothetical protein